MSNIFDQIANVTIGIQSSVSEDISYDKILIVGALPAVAPATAPAQVGYYESLSDVTSAGWVASGTGKDPVGVAAALAFAQNPKPTGIYIAPIQVNNSTAEDIDVTIARAMETDGWWVCCPVGVADAQIVKAATYIETKEKFLLYSELAFFGAGSNNTNARAVTAECTRTAAIFGKETSDQASGSIPDNNKYINVAFAIAWLAYASGSETAAYKQLVDIKTASLTETERTALAAAKVSYFYSIGSRNVTVGGKVLAGEWMDIIRFRDWLKNDMQTRIVNLFLDNPKVPFTDGGIALVHNAVQASLKSGQEAGGIVPDEYDNEGNETLGFQVVVPSAVNIPSADKALRILNGIEFTAHLSGAIHVTTINGTLAYSL